MRKPLTIVMVLAACGAAAAQKSPLPANPACEHPVGDKVKGPCMHRKQKHPGGCAPPCSHPPVALHKDGDEKKVPCTHFGLQHPNGHDTGRKVPCVHWKNGKQEHPGGDAVIEPCGHWVAQHGEDTVKVPCVHLVPLHPNGDEGKIACPHYEAEHPDGDEIWVPCTHLLKIVKQESDPPINFYTDDKEIQTQILGGYRKLRDLGVKIKWIRPLSVYLREPVTGKYDNDDPFWHHYNGNTHAIVILKDTTNDADRKKKRVGTVYHEMGHSLQEDRCVRVNTPGGKHEGWSESDAGLALSEGWAHFVALALMNDRGAAAPDRARDENFETMEQKTDAPYSARVENRVAAILWDIYDSREDGGDRISMDFRALWQVYSPTLETLTRGPRIADLEDFLTRLKKNNPGQAAGIDAAKEHNLKKPKGGK